MQTNWMLAFGCLVIVLMSTRVNASDCKDLTSCGGCVSQEGKSCGWCALDRKCYKFSANSNPFTGNPCQWGMSTTDLSDCKAQPSFEYSKTLSFHQLLFSAVAYTEQTDVCIDKINKSRDDVEWDYQVHSMVSMKCDDYVFAYKECFAVVAISHNTKSILVSFRGTNSTKQLFDEFISNILPKSSLGKGNVQRYFQNAFKNLYACLNEEIVELHDSYPDYFVRFSGHSLGGALASIAAFKFSELQKFSTEKISLYTYGMPRVGDKLFAADHDKKVPNSWRVTNYKDCVPHVPPCVYSCNIEYKTSPYHHGLEVFYDDANMTRHTEPTMCHGNEENTCSNKYFSGLSGAFNLLSCKHYHTNYFNIQVGSYCDMLSDRRRKRSEPSDIYHLLSKDKCSIVKRVDGEWKVTWSPPTLSSAMQAKSMISLYILLMTLLLQL